MSMLRRVFQIELLLLFRNKLLVIPFALNVIGWGYIVLAYEMQATHTEERAAAFYSGFVWILFINLLLIGLFSVYMISKDRESEFEALVVTYRVKNVEWITGKWLVTQLYGLGITFITVFVQVGWFVSGKMYFGDVAKNTLYVLVQMEGAFFLLISLGFLFGTILKSVFAYIVIPAMLVLSLGLPFDYTGVAYTYDNPKFHLLTPFDYMFIESPYEGIWGINRVFESSLLHQLVIFLLGVIALLGTLLLFHSNRRVQREKKLVPILMIILILPTLLFGGIRYAQYNKALEQFVTTTQMYVKGYEGTNQLEEYSEWENTYYDAYLDHSKYDFAMEHTNLAVKLQSDNQIDVTSKLTIKHKGEAPTQEVKLTLYHGLQVTECTSYSEITCTRDKDFVTLHFEEMIEPGEVRNIKLKYEGNILQYRDEGYIEQAFIQKDRVYLPKEAAWYPLIGERQLIVAREHNNNYFQFEQRNGRLEEDFPTAFTVKITNENKEIPLALTVPEVEEGMYQGTSQYGLSLIGGNLKERVVDGIRIVGNPEVLNSAEEVVKEYQKTWSFIEEWLEVPMTPEVIYILNDQHYYLTLESPSQEVLIWSTAHLEGKSDSTIAFWVVDYLINQYAPLVRERDLGLLDDAITWSILSESPGEGGFKDQYVSNWRHIGDKDMELVNILSGYEEQGIDKFNEVVKFVYKQYSQLEDKNNFDMEAALQLYEREKSL